jgi:hypothetical protein
MEWIWRVLFFLGGIGFLLFWIAIFKVGSDLDLRIEIAKLKRDLALKETWNQNISKDLDDCCQERAKLEAALLARERWAKMGAVNEAVDSFKRLGVPDTNEETHD